MLFVNPTPIYLKCGILLPKNEENIKEIEDLKSTFQYFQTNLSINLNSNILLLFKINYFKIDHFKLSPDYAFLQKKLNITSKSSEQKETETSNKDSITLSNELPLCYFCGHITEKRESIIKELFNKKPYKVGNVNQLTIYGIDYITENIENSFFNLPNQSISKLIKIGQGLESVNEKYPLSLKGNLYPYLMANALEGVSVYRVDSINKYTRLGGNTMGATTLWSLLTLTCGYEDPDIVLIDATKGDNQFIDLSVGDIYGGNYSQFSLQSDLIASSFGKLKYVKDISKVQKKDIARSLVTLYASSVSQITAMLSMNSQLDKAIVLGNPFNSLELMQMVKVCTGYFSGNKVNSVFSDYSQFLEIIGMCVEYDKGNKMEYKEKEEEVNPVEDKKIKETEEKLLNQLTINKEEDKKDQ